MSISNGKTDNDNSDSFEPASADWRSVYDQLDAEQPDRDDLRERERETPPRARRAVFTQGDVYLMPWGPADDRDATVAYVDPLACDCPGYTASVPADEIPELEECAAKVEPVDLIDTPAWANDAVPACWLEADEPREVGV